MQSMERALKAIQDRSILNVPKGEGMTEAHIAA